MHLIPQSVYLLCAATSLLCALLLYRAYRRSGARLLLWSCLCFVFLTANNALLFVDLAIYPNVEVIFLGVNLPVIRSVCALCGLLLLVFGLIWDST